VDPHLAPTPAEQAAGAPVPPTVPDRRER